MLHESFCRGKTHARVGDELRRVTASDAGHGERIATPGIKRSAAPHFANRDNPQDKQNAPRGLVAPAPGTQPHFACSLPYTVCIKRKEGA